MRKLAILLTFVTLSVTAQSTKDILAGASFDLIKSDYDKAFAKLQTGVEAHYFIERHFGVGLGFEMWSRHPKSEDFSASFVMGARWYPIDDFFVRARGFMGANDFAIGGGWSKPIKDVFRLEVMSDFYFASADVGLRVGAAYVLKLKKK